MSFRSGKATRKRSRSAEKLQVFACIAVS
jgi:hypothetical protein